MYAANEHLQHISWDRFVFWCIRISSSIAKSIILNVGAFVGITLFEWHSFDLLDWCVQRFLNDRWCLVAGIDFIMFALSATGNLAARLRRRAQPTINRSHIFRLSISAIGGVVCVGHATTFSTSTTLGTLLFCYCFVSIWLFFYTQHAQRTAHNRHRTWIDGFSSTPPSINDR